MAFYITQKDSETGKKFQALCEKWDKSHNETVKISEQLGFNQFYLDDYFIEGAIDVIVFDKEPCLETYKKVGKKGYKPRISTEKGRAVDKMLLSITKVSKEELNSCVGFRCNLRSIGFDHNDDYFGFTTSPAWKLRVPKDCKEVTETKYYNVFNDTNTFQTT